MTNPSRRKYLSSNSDFSRIKAQKIGFIAHGYLE
jgi:hypothetical protein